MLLSSRGRTRLSTRVLRILSLRCDVRFGAETGRSAIGVGARESGPSFSSSRGRFDPQSDIQGHFAAPRIQTFVYVLSGGRLVPQAAFPLRGELLRLADIRSVWSCDRNDPDSVLTVRFADPRSALDSAE